MHRVTRARRASTMDGASQSTDIWYRREVLRPFRLTPGSDNAIELTVLQNWGIKVRNTGSFLSIDDKK